MIDQNEILRRERIMALRARGVHYAIGYECLIYGIDYRTYCDRCMDAGVYPLSFSQYNELRTYIQENINGN